MQSPADILYTTHKHAHMHIQTASDLFFVLAKATIHIISGYVSKSVLFFCWCIHFISRTSTSVETVADSIYRLFGILFRTFPHYMLTLIVIRFDRWTMTFPFVSGWIVLQHFRVRKLGAINFTVFFYRPKFIENLFPYSLSAFTTIYGLVHLTYMFCACAACSLSARHCLFLFAIRIGSLSVCFSRLWILRRSNSESVVSRVCYVRLNPVSIDFDFIGFVGNVMKRII